MNSRWGFSPPRCRSKKRIFLYHIGTICLLMTVCRILLAKVRNEKHNSIEINQLCISVAELHSFPEFLSNIGSDLNRCSNLCLKNNLITLSMFLVSDALFLLLAYQDSVVKAIGCSSLRGGEGELCTIKTLTYGSN